MRRARRLKLWTGFFILSLLAASRAPTANEATQSAEIRAVLLQQQDAWNRGDIMGFMNGYARSENTVFVSADQVSRGWQTVYDRYLKKYGDRAKMGILTFSELEVMPLSPEAALVLGRWELKRANDQPRGRFTLVFRKTADGWRIVHDHTSNAE